VARKYVIGVDSSTTACKAIAWDRKGRVVAEGRIKYPTLNPRPDWYEQDAELWWKSLCSALTDLFENVSPSQIEALCISNQRETVVPVDTEGSPLRPGILWLDERCREQLDFLERSIGGQRLLEITGKPLSKVPCLPKILWIAQTEPEVYARCRKFLEAHAFLVHRLTGRYRTSLACADPMGLIDMRVGSWAQDLLQEVGLREDQFAELVVPGEILGTVSAEAAALTGHPRDCL
jgi:xylulokinase